MKFASLSLVLSMGMAAAFTSLSAAAQEVEDLPAPSMEAFHVERVGFHLGSHHWPSKRKGGTSWNNVNPGAYVVFSNGATLGGYYNSYSKPSFYAGKTFRSSACGWGLTVGVVTGYPSGPRPMLAPSLCVADHLRLTLMTNVRKLTVVSASLEF